MVATGGAGPVHVVEVARKLQIPRVLATIAAGAGSCLGLLAAPARVDRSWSNPTLVTDIDWRKRREGVTVTCALMPKRNCDPPARAMRAQVVDRRGDALRGPGAQRFRHVALAHDQARPRRLR